MPSSLNSSSAFASNSLNSQIRKSKCFSLGRCSAMRRIWKIVILNRKNFRPMWSRCPPKRSNTRLIECHNGPQSVQSIVHCSSKIGWHFRFRLDRPILQSVEHVSTRGPTGVGATVDKLAQVWSYLGGHRRSRKWSTECTDKFSFYLFFNELKFHSATDSLSAWWAIAGRFLSMEMRG